MERISQLENKLTLRNILKPIIYLVTLAEIKGE